MSTFEEAIAGLFWVTVFSYAVAGIVVVGALRWYAKRRSS